MFVPILYSLVLSIASLAAVNSNSRVSKTVAVQNGPGYNVCNDPYEPEKLM